MALIYRALFNVTSSEFVASAPEVAQDWLRWKLRRDDITVGAEDGSVEAEDRGATAHWWLRQDDDSRAVFRTIVYEDRKALNEQVRTTFTAFADGETSWALTDIERWVTSPDAHAWIPVAPSIVTDLLDRFECRRGNTRLCRSARVVAPSDVAVLVRELSDEARELPIVIATTSDLEPTKTSESRAFDLAKTLAGVAPVVLLAPGAVSEFSKTMFSDFGERMDVYRSSVRVYNPGLGASGDSPYRHRLVQFRRFQGRPNSVAVRVVAGPILARSTETPPPPVWRSHIRELLDSTGGDDAELIELYEEENQEVKRTLAELSDSNQELQLQYEQTEEDNSELLKELDELRGLIRFLQSRLADYNSPDAYVTTVAEDPFTPDWCAEVVDEAKKRFALLVIPDTVRDGAAALDEHVNPNWGRRAWSAFQALQAYAEAKQAGRTGDFRTYCESHTDGAKVPTSWIGRHESKTTTATERFRRLRMLPISKEVDSSGSILMEEHIRIQQGGMPSPRIHYHDDTGGATGKIHVGWFGDHLDSAGKS